MRCEVAVSCSIGVVTVKDWGYKIQAGLQRVGGVGWLGLVGENRRRERGFWPVNGATQRAKLCVALAHTEEAALWEELRALDASGRDGAVAAAAAGIGGAPGRPLALPGCTLSRWSLRSSLWHLRPC
jgi:hypothetical protein